MKNEAHARIIINKLLEEAGWRFLDDENGKANILLENHVKITQEAIHDWGVDYEMTKNGSLDLATPAIVVWAQPPGGRNHLVRTREAPRSWAVDRKPNSIA